MELLRREPVSQEELHMVRNYLMGTFLTMLDGPFNMAELVRSCITEGLPLESFEALVHTVRRIEAPELQELAWKYLDPDKMWEVIVGNP